MHGHDPNERSTGARAARLAMAGLMALALTSCTVKYTYLKPGYDGSERHRFKRIHLYVHPVSGRAALAPLVNAVAREFVSVQTNYMLYPARKNGASTAGLPFKLCGVSVSGKVPDGLLLLTVRKSQRSDGKVRLGVEAQLAYCPQKTGATLWKAYAESSYQSEDPDLKTVIASFSNRIGKSARPYAAPAYLLVRTLLRELPNPTLTEAEKLEKIEMME